jgi:hypothetical protein
MKKKNEQTAERIPTIALDAPSALTLYRDRDDAARVASPPVYEPVRREISYLSDEDIAASLADTNIFGHRAFDPLVDGAGESTGMAALVRSRARSFVHCASRSRDIKRIPFDSLGLRAPSKDSPLYMLVPNKLARRRINNVKQRACSVNVPTNTLKRLGYSVLVPSPELTLLLLTHHVGLIEVIVAGMELCGRYRLVGAQSKSLFSSNRTLYDVGQLSSPSYIARLEERAAGFEGRAVLKRACNYVAPNSSSPMETVVYLLLCLPRSMGGYGLPKPLLNAKRRVTSVAGSITMSNTLVPDLYWIDARLDLEYDSDEFHSDCESLRKGARRTMAFRAMNVDVLSMTHDIVCDERAFDVVARMIAKRLGVRLPAEAGMDKSKRRELRSILLG